MLINIGILGFAHGHVDAYVTAWKKMKRTVHVVGGWDHDFQRVAKAGERHGLQMYDNPEDLLASGDVDAVMIAAETSLHAELVEMAARAGKTVILQKPMALTLEEADRIVRAVKRSGVRFTLAWQMRVDPQNVQMRKLVQDARLGRIFMIRRRHGLSTHTWAGFENTWHVKPELNRGMWADDAAHPIDWLLWMKGLPESVSAEIATLHSPKVPDDNGVAVFRYADGTLAEIACSFTCLAGENTTEIVGEKGVIIQNFGDGPSAQAPRADDAAGLKWLLKGHKQWTISGIRSPENHGQRIANLAKPLCEFLQGKREPICTAEEGRMSLAMTLACYRSSELGRRVMIAEMDQKKLA
ncbi:MAG TPA: Gfo/Idh/MocA family oxidoreductase [Tepidisphaeraceae bacterium]|jgi:predicted dehydrogenase